MKINKPIVLALLCTMMLNVFSACQTPSEGRPQQQDSTDQTTKEEDTTSVVPDAGPITYTLPHYADKSGTVQWEYSYSPDGLSLSKTDNTEEPPITYTVRFNEEGLPLNMEWTVIVNDTRTEKWEDIYTLDDNGNIVTEKRYCEGELQHTYIYTYDAEGRIISQTTYKEKDSSCNYYRLTYDGKGECIHITHSLNSKPETEYKEALTTAYDENGRLISAVSPSYSINYEYSLTEELVTTKKVSYQSQNAKWSYYYQYTYEDSKLKKEDTYFSGILTETNYYTESEHEHYVKAVDWMFRERLP
ncbi:MAG: hypothetical protein E7575_05350 [Ruminococcaceae bacterium]|nr:hypothetical protein [Oscillospiraceae bacterium]